MSSSGRTDVLFEALESAHLKPEAFSRYTAKDLWTDAHTSARMLEYHLNEHLDVSSRRHPFIDESVRWMVSHFDLSAGSRIVDFGCGPGLYTARFAEHFAGLFAGEGAEVVGIDFSPRSIAYARDFAAQNGLPATYVEADYLEYLPDGRFDLITMIMCDFCALSPTQRASLLARFERLLADDGKVILDVYSLGAFERCETAFLCEKNQLNGFWSLDPYYALVSRHRYEEEKVSLDRYVIIEQARQREVFNWLQYFSPDSLRQEVRSAGLAVSELYADVAGHPYDADLPEFAVVLGRA